MSTRFPALALVFGLILGLPPHPAARADDVTMKNGRKWENVKVTAETEKEVVIRTPEGKAIRLARADVVSVEKKRTALDELEEKRAQVDPKNGRALLELATWCGTAGLTADRDALLRQALKAAPDDPDVRAAAGYEKVGGRWVTAKEAERERAKAAEAEYRARGWRRLEDGTWVSPEEHALAKKGFQKIEGVWYSKEEAKKVRAGLVFVEGDWVTAEEMAEQIGKGLRRHEGRWLPIRELDEKHRKWSDPWILRGRSFALSGTVNHSVLRGWLDRLEAMYPHMCAFFGQTALTAERPLWVYISKDIDEYRTFGQQGMPDWAAQHSSDYGAFFSPNVAEGAGAGITYLHTPEFLERWVPHAATHAFVNRIADESRLDNAFIEAAAGYFTGMWKDGRFAPTWDVYATALKGATLFPGSTILTKVTRTDEALPRFGLFLHFVRTRHGGLFDAFMKDFWAGKGSAAELQSRLVKVAGAEALDADFTAFVGEFHKAYVPPDR